jgi:predicted nicotinamide N-methyase
MRCTETIDFGPFSGITDIIQLSGEAFQCACLQANSMTDDSTGLRIHGGAHVAVRFLLRHPHLIDDMKVCEVGCGTGVYGLIGTRGGTISAHLALTDGNSAAVAIALQNSDQLVSLMNSSKVSCEKLLWGSVDCVEDFLGSLDTVLSQHRNEVDEQSAKVSPTSSATLSMPDAIEIENVTCRKRHFDVVIGCELFYYRTNIDELLCTVLRLTNNNGLFIHSHVFRRSGQDVELIEYLRCWNWITAEIPIQRFVDQDELDEHPEWFNVHCLVSGPTDKILALLSAENRCCSGEEEEAVSLLSAKSAGVNGNVPDKPDFQWRLFTGTAATVTASEKAASESDDLTNDIDALSVGNLFA